jgi:anti-sigma-K factor RskA
MIESRPPAEDEDPVPLFGSWRAIYAAVIACAVAVMVLVAVFSRWSF